MGVKLLSSGGGSVEMLPPSTASSYNITVPAATTTLVGTDTTQTLTNKTLTTPNIDSAQFATVSGTAPIYPCRAWVNFNGTGTVAIRASGNVTSITDNGAGNYTVNFTTAMPDANFSAVSTCAENAGVSVLITRLGTLASGSCQIYMVNRSDGSLADSATVAVSIFR